MTLDSFSTVSALMKTLADNNDAFSKLDLKSYSKQISTLKNYFPFSTQTLSRKDSIKKIADFYKDEKLVLVLGAGASLDFGLPTWPTLLQKLIRRTLNNLHENNDSVARLFESVFGPNSLISARYLANHYNELEKSSSQKYLFEDAIRICLYEDISLDKDSLLFKEIVKLCASVGKYKGLNSVISYNYDDLLEYNLEKLGLDVLFKTVSSVGQNPESNQLPIYHVHGFLPRNDKLTDKNIVTLSDYNYHSQYVDIYGWSNMVQLNKFKDYNCLFIGTSFTDPNQRRLLDIAKKQRGNDNIQHFIIKKKYNSKDIENVISKILITDNKIFNDKEKANLNLNDISSILVEVVHKFETNDAHSFGCEMIWVDEYEDIPIVLKEIGAKIKK